MKLMCSLVSLGLLAVCSLPLAAAGQETVWKIGTFDRSSGEFRDGAPSGPVTFVAGQSDAAKGWYADAPALFATGKADAGNAPRAIQFSMEGKPAAAYRLHVALLIEHSSQPALRVAVNGHEGTFYLHPKLDYSMGDTVAAFFPAYSHADVEADRPRRRWWNRRSFISSMAMH
jgi:hypothetical protein